MKERYFKMYFCYHHEQEKNPNQYKEFVGITTADRVEQIIGHYSNLWGLIIDPQPHLDPEKLTESKILQEWEGFDLDPLLECVETGEKFWYISTRDDKGLDSYELINCNGASDQ